MIGPAVLVAGLLLILTALVGARIPDGATFARPGIARSPVRAFLLSPVHPATWHANAAIVLGLVIGVTAFAMITTLVSVGLTILLAGVGLVFIALAIEGSRIVARIERRRASIGRAGAADPAPVSAAARRHRSICSAPSSPTRAAGAMSSMSQSTCHCRSSSSS